MKNKNEAEMSVRECPVVYVGMGPCGLQAFLNESNEEAIALESEDSYLGRAGETALHLIDSSFNSPLLQITHSYERFLLKWDRQWIPPNEVNWDDSEWSQVLPQWNFYFEGQKRLALWNREKISTLKPRINFSAPVSLLKKESDRWFLQTPNLQVYAHKVVWAAGIRAFQNAYGKIESQDFLHANPNFNDDIREFLGGISLTWSFPKSAKLVDGFPEQHVWGLPVKHDKKYYLSIGAIHSDEKGFHISTLTYLPDEIAQNPKELSSFHKSLKRSIKYQLSEDQEPFQQEILIHNPHLLGHSLGLHWVFKDEHMGIRFIGDDSLKVASQKNFGLNSLQYV